LIKHSKFNNKLVLITSILILTLNCKNETSPTLKTLKHTSVLDKIIARDTLRIGTTLDFIPFSYSQDGKENYQGIDIELAKNLATSLGVHLLFVQTSWPTLLSDLESGTYDIGMSGITINLARQQKAYFSIPTISSGKVAITRKENANKFQSIAEINSPHVKVIFNPGGTNEIFAIKNFPKAQLILNETNLNIFQKIVDGGADIMVTDAIETLVQERIHPELQAINSDKPFNFFEMGYLLPKDITFKNYVDQWLHLRKKDGTFDRIFNSELNKITSETITK
jgi:cyclohexadienyl dehydratase